MKRRKILVPIPQSPEVNVTPLIDIVLVLLIIFMVVSPLVDKNLSTRLAETTTAVEARPDPTQIVVHIDDDGTIKINDDAITGDDYVHRLRERLSGRTPTSAVVLFDADDSAGYGRLVNALDGAKQAGGTTLGFVMPESKSEK